MKNEKQPITEKVDFTDRLSAFLQLLVMAVVYAFVFIVTIPLSVYRLIIEKESMRDTWREFGKFSIKFWRK